MNEGASGNERTHPVGAGRIWWQVPGDRCPIDAVGEIEDVATPWIVVGTASFLAVERKVTGRDRLPGPVPEWSSDLFRVARAVFLADKYVRREGAPDHWTRRMTVSIPVVHVERWTSPPALQHLAALLETISGDHWQLNFRRLERGRSGVADIIPGVGDEPASEVALFSGGLDSLAWAAHRAATLKENGGLLLVMFDESPLQRVQQRVWEAVQQIARARSVRVQRLRLSQRPAGDGNGWLELSSRTRGLLYAAGAVRAATAHGVRTVCVPENGQMAVNPPLTAARVAASSTRSVHPQTLHHLNALISAVDDPDSALPPVRVVNPLAGLTKGEVCRLARTAGLEPRVLDDTLSCGKSPARAKDGSGRTNCGCCYPCLVRRAGLIHGQGVDGTDYDGAPWEADASPGRCTDWHALRQWLEAPFDVFDLLADTPMPAGVDPEVVLAVVLRGRVELSRLADMARRPV